MSKRRGSIPLSQHLLWGILLAAGIALRLVVTAAYSPALMLQRDTHTYLLLAVGAPSGGIRPLFYPWLLEGALAVHNLTVVAVTQHLLGILMAVATYALLRRLGVVEWLAALGSAPILLDAYQLNIEHYILAETVFQTLTFGVFAALVWWKRPPLWAAGLAGGLVALAGMTRFVGLVLIAPCLLYALIARIGWARAAALVAGFALPLAAITIASESDAGTSPGATQGFFLYGRVRSFADCRVVDVPERLRELCFSEPPEERGENFGFFSTSTEARRALRDDPDANAKLLEFSRRMIVGQPLGYVGAVVADLWRYFEPVAPPNKEPYARRWLFVTSLAEADPLPEIQELEGSPPPEADIRQRFHIAEGPAAFLRGYQRVVFLWGPLVALLVGLGAAGALFGRAGPSGGARVRAAAALATLMALALMLGAVMTTVYHFRYGLAVVPLLGPAGALGAAALTRRRAETRDAGAQRRAGPDASLPLTP